nr:MAG TPA: hypothetical protein [Caudoviricetes sp.]
MTGFISSTSNIVLFLPFCRRGPLRHGIPY